jgi:periplasmic protein TonB
MSVEEKKSCAEGIGALSSCLIEGDPEQKTRERKIKRRALAISIALQSAALVGLVLVPLLGHTEKIVYRVVTPMPPYRHQAPRPIQRAATTPPPVACGFCTPTRIPPNIVTVDHSSSNPTSNTGAEINIGENVPDARGLIDIFGRSNMPPPPGDPDQNKKKRISVGGAVQQAMLTHRVEPGYPPLARQLRVSGQVHLRAIISTDGSIESLQVMDGHPLLVQSALDAVRQWHYQPTKLDGQPVEVETIITIVYALNQ